MGFYLEVECQKCQTTNVYGKQNDVKSNDNLAMKQAKVWSSALKDAIIDMEKENLNHISLSKILLVETKKRIDALIESTAKI